MTLPSGIHPGHSQDTGSALASLNRVGTGPVNGGVASIRAAKSLSVCLSRYADTSFTGPGKSTTRTPSLAAWHAQATA